MKLMPDIMIFKEMIEENSMPFVSYEENEGHWDDGGDWIPGGIIPVNMNGLILPLSDDDLRYSEMGTYSSQDRKLFTLQPLKKGQKVEYKGIQYTVQNFKDLTDFADVFIYIARWAGNESSKH